MTDTQLTHEIRRITSALDGLRLPAMPGEYDIHGEISKALAAHALDFAHEYRLAPRCRIDFRVGRIGIEVKKGRPASSDLTKQLRRYLASEELDAMIVVTQRVVSIPKTILGKPVYIVSLNRLWGVALP